MDKALRLQVILSLADKALKPLKGIAKGGQEASKELRAARDALKGLEQQQADLSSFRAMKREVQQSNQALEAARKRATELGRANAQVEKPTRAMTAEFRRARTEVQKLERDLQTKAGRLRDVRTRLDAAGIGVGNFAAAERRLKTETAQANAELQRQQQRLKAIGEHHARLSAAQDRYGKTQAVAGNVAIAGAASTGAGVAILAPAKSAFDDYAALQSSMTDIGQKADLTRRQTRAMQDQLAALGPKVGQTAEAMAAGVDVLSGFGLSPQDAAAIIGPIGKVSRAYKAEMADISAASFATHDNLKVDLKDTARTLDIMAYAGKRGAFELKDMAQYFPQLTAAAQGLRQTGVGGVADLAAALQITRKGAGDAASAATNLDNLLQKIASPATVKKFGQMGVNLDKAMAAARAQGKTPIEAIVEITNRTLKGDLSKIGYLFEDAQVQKALRPLIQNFEEYKAIRADALKATGVVDSDFAMRMQDDAEQAQAAARQVQALKLRLGADLAPTIIKVAAAAGALADRFSRWTADHPKLSAALAVTAVVVGGLLVTFGALALVVAAVLGPFALMQFAFTGALPLMALMGGALKGLTLGFLKFGAALLLNPITWIVLGIVAAVALLAAGAYLIYKNWGKIAAWFGGVWEKFKSAAGAALKAVAGFILRFTPLGLFIRVFAPLLPFVVRTLSAIGRAVWTGLKAVGSVFGAIASVVAGALGAVGRVVMTGLSFVGRAILAFTPLGFVIRNWAPISGFLANLWDGAKALVSNAMKAILGFLANGDPVGALITAFGKVWPWLTSLGARFTTIGGQLIAGLISGITGGLGKLRDSITGMAGSAVSWIKKTLGIHSPSRVFAGIGDYSMQGLALGLTRSQDAPLKAIGKTAAAMAAGMTLSAGPVAAAAADTSRELERKVVMVTEAPRPPRPAAPPSARTPGAVAQALGGDRYEFHIHQQPGQSAEDLARSIEVVLERRDRAKAAAARSSFRDDED